MSDTPTPETDAEAMDGIDGYGDTLKSWDYKKAKHGEVVPAEFARRLERERDKAREELAILKAECAKISEEFGLPPTVRPADGEIKRMINGGKEALRERDAAWEELSRVRKELVASNRGAEKNAKVNQGLCARLTEAERERDEARRERDEARRELDAVLQRLSLWEGAVMRMKKQLSFAPPFRTEEA